MVLDNVLTSGWKINIYQEGAKGVGGETCRRIKKPLKIVSTCEKKAKRGTGEDA